MTNGRHYSAADRARLAPEIRRIASASGLAMPLSEIKEDLRVDSEDEDRTVARMARAAAAFLEIRTGCVGLAGRFEIRLADWPTEPVQIRRWPLRGLESVQYLKDASPRPVWTDWPVDNIFADPHPQYFEIACLARAGTPPTDLYRMERPIRIVFAAGFDTVAESGEASGDDFATGAEPLPIDDGIRNVLQALIAHFYENRELFAADKAAEVQSSAGSLLTAYRQFW